MSTRIRTGGTLTLDGGTQIPVDHLEFVGPEVHTEEGWIPDTTWTHTDSNGHLHAYWLPTGDRKRPGRDDGDPQTPTLMASSRHVECDGSCGGVCDGEGYYEPVWHCIACGDEVTPGVKRGTITIQLDTGHIALRSTSHSIDGGVLMPKQLPMTPATLLYPSGPGQMTEHAGKVIESGSSTYCHDSGGGTLTREFMFYRT